MTETRTTAAHDDRVLVLAPTARDAETTQALLAEEGIPVVPCQTFCELVQQLGTGASAILFPEEALTQSNLSVLQKWVESQPPWSDLPLLVLARAGADSSALKEAVRVLGNVTLLERPLRVSTLVSAVRTALRARQRQYQIRGHLENSARAEAALRLADQRKDEFLATLGHELRNPLAPIATGLHLLHSSPHADQRMDSVLSAMDRQVAHLIRLVDDLLEISRITRGLVEVRHEPVDLTFVVRSAIETSRPTIEAARHQLEVSLPLEAVTVDGDSVRLTQVVANILTNAAKYTNPGGQIRITLTRWPDRASISVRDNGIGIPAEHLSSVFEMFTQVDRSSRRTQGGLGIGLTLVRTLVAMHGGRVEAKSAGAGQGSEFIVELPLAMGQVAVARRVNDMRLPPRRILVVDDNRDAAETLTKLLCRLGASARVVFTGRAALAILDEFDPETLLLDIGMPGMDGYELARRVRMDPRHRRRQLIALTGWGQERDQEKSRAAGFDHHLIKPPDIEKLRDLLAS